MSDINKKPFVYIVQNSHNTTVCKIGITDNLERRLKEYNNQTGKSKSEKFQYLFTCETKNARKVENDIKTKFSYLREAKSKEMYFFNDELLKLYVDFIKSNSFFIKELTFKQKPSEVKIVQKETPSLEERGLKRLDLINMAKKNKNDEFYTRYEDIEKEIATYPLSTWEEKTIFCNCDDAVDSGALEDGRKSSAFAVYFLKNFNRLKLKMLICTHYEKSNLYTLGKKTKGYIFRKTGFNTFEDALNSKEFPSDFNGDFRHPVSLKILKEEADIVVTNPPFSLSREFWKIIIDSKKKFLILSNEMNVINSFYIPYFKHKKVWAGQFGVYNFYNPKKQIVRASARWFTNIPIKEHQMAKNIKFVPLKDIPDKYKYFDDSNTLIVDNGYIPIDYNKPFAVSQNVILNGLLDFEYNYVQEKLYESYINGKRQFARALVAKEKGSE